MAEAYRLNQVSQVGNKKGGGGTGQVERDRHA